jgi:hypothetical protein
VEAAPPAALPPAQPSVLPQQPVVAAEEPSHDRRPPRVLPWGPALKLQLNAPGDGVTLSVNRWAVTFFGHLELDAIYDSTQSFIESMGHAAIARGNTYAGTHGRVIFGARSSRLSWRIDAPKLGSVETSAYIQMDFVDPNAPVISASPEGAYFGSPYPRLRHAAMNIRTPVVDIIAGQYWGLIGWQGGNYTATTAQVPGLPGNTNNRTAQFRLSKTFRSNPVNFELAGGVFKPPQNNSAVPDGQFGFRLLFNEWQGLHQDYSYGAVTPERAMIGFVGAVRRLAVPESYPGAATMMTNPAPPAMPAPLTPNPTQLATTAWGLSVNALIPVIPRRTRGHALTVVGEFTYGKGNADFYQAPPPGAGTSLAYPSSCSNPTASTINGVAAGQPALGSNGCLDPGMAIIKDGKLEAVAWQAFTVGATYYLPPTGSVYLSFFYSQIQSPNARELVATPTPATWDLARNFDANLWFQPTPALRFVLNYNLYEQEMLDGAKSRNHRAQFSSIFLF